MFTIVSYWMDKSYNLYCWFKPHGSYVASYFNVVKLPGYEFKKDMLIYHDLILDVLVYPNSKTVVLDSNELSDVDDVTSKQAKRISESILKSAPQIVNENLSTLPEWLKRKED